MISGNNEVVSMDITQPTPRNSWLTPGEICYLVQFFTSRLADFGTQVEVLFCLHVLLYNYCRTKHGTTPAPIDARNVNAIILSLSEEVHTQSLSVNARRWVFEILKLLLEDYSSALADQDQDGSAYVYCFIQAMDGEKDPRNLVLCFDLVTDICRTLPTRVYIRFSEELFEVTSCYFPITFQERKDDPHAVKRTDLVTKLNSALGACPGLASHVVPFLLDKLTASLVQTKLDTLVCLRHVIRAYLERGWGREIDVHNANEGRIIQSVWSGVRQELMTSTDQPVIDECLVSLRDIVLSLSLHDTNDMQHYFKYALLNPQQQHAFDWPHASYLHFMLNALTKDCHQQLKSFDSKVSLLSAQVLHTAASAHFKSSTIILHHSIPWLMSLYTTETDLDNKLAIVNIIADFIRFTSDVQLDSTTSIQGLKGPHPLRVFKDELFALLSSLSQSTESRQHSVALQALTHLAVITDQPDTSHTAQPLLLEQQTSLVITYLTAALTHHDTTLRQLARKSLVQLASYSWLIAPLQQLCIQSLVHSLNELTLASFKTQHVAKDVSLIAEALTDLSVTNSVLYHAIINKLLAMMYNVLQTTLSSTEAYCGVEIVEQLLDAILSCFNNLLPIHRTAMKSAGLSSEWQLTESWSINVHHALLVLALHTAGQSGVSIALHESITRHLLAISTTLVSMLHDQLQVHDTFVDQVLFQFYLQRNIPFLHELLNNVDELNKQLPDLAALLQTHPITLGAVTVTPFLVELIAAVTCVVNKQLTEQHLTLCTQLLTALFDQTLAALSPRTRQLLAIAVASLFDKIPLSASAAMDQFLTARLPQLLSTVQDASVALVTRESAVMLLIYVSVLSCIVSIPLTHPHPLAVVCRLHSPSTSARRQVAECVVDGVLAARDWSVAQSRSHTRALCSNELQRAVATRSRDGNSTDRTVRAPIRAQVLAAESRDHIERDYAQQEAAVPSEDLHLRGTDVDERDDEQSAELGESLQHCAAGLVAAHVAAARGCVAQRPQRHLARAVQHAALHGHAAHSGHHDCGPLVGVALHRVAHLLAQH